MRKKTGSIDEQFVEQPRLNKLAIAGSSEVYTHSCYNILSNILSNKIRRKACARLYLQILVPGLRKDASRA
jgi:hypothetical protein